MAFILADRVKETTATTGTGALTLAGAVTGYNAFSVAMAVNDYCYYAIENDTRTEWEVGTGQLTASTTLVRVSVIASSNANAAVNFSAGTKGVYITAAAAAVKPFHTTGLFANAAALRAITSPAIAALVDGSRSWVQSFKDYFRWSATSTLTDDGKTIINPTANAGNGRFLRMNIPAVEWKRQLNWFIDPSNGAASDENDGATAGAPLATGAEAVRRWGKTDWFAGDYHVRVISNIASPDYLAFFGARVMVPGGSTTAKIFLHGSATNGQGKSTLYTGSITTLVTLTRTASPQHSWEFTDTAIPTSWTASGLISDLNNTAPRLRMTSGASSGAFGWPMADLTGKAAKISALMSAQTAFATGTGLVVSNKTPAAADTFVVEDLVKIGSLTLAITATDWTAIGDLTPNGTGPYFVIESLAIGQTELIITPGDRYDFVGCFDETSFSSSKLGRINRIGCTSHNVQVVCTPSLEAFYGGWASHQVQVAGRGEFGYDFMIQGSIGTTGFLVSQTGFAQVVNPAGTAGLAVFGSTGPGIKVERGGTLSTRDTFFKIWGDTNVYGIDVRPGGQFVSSSATFAGCTITGTSGDVSIKGVGTALAFDPSATPPGYVATPRTLSWANLAATVASAGFGGIVTDPTYGAFIGPA